MIGTKFRTEDAGVHSVVRGRKALYMGGSRSGSDGGPYTGDHADMSSEKPGENPGHRKPKDSWGRFVHPGLVGP